MFLLHKECRVNQRRSRNSTSCVVCPPSKPSGKVRETHSVGSICDHDFGVFTVTDIATENTDAVPPADAVPRLPDTDNHGLQRCCGPRVPLTCLALRTAWQSLCHVDSSLENCVALAFADGDRPSGTSRYFLQPRPERSPRWRESDASRKQAEAFRDSTGFRDDRSVLRERALVEFPEREFYRFRSDVNRSPLDPSYRRLRRRRPAGPLSGP